MGVKVWPPKWLQTYGPDTGSVSGEVGTLEAVFLSQVMINKIHLLMHTKRGNVYIGSLMFENSDCAKAVFDFLYKQTNKSLTTIGAMDFPPPTGEGGR
jgi:hypothetical protein